MDLGRLLDITGVFSTVKRVVAAGLFSCATRTGREMIVSFDTGSSVSRTGGEFVMIAESLE